MIKQKSALERMGFQDHPIKHALNEDIPRARGIEAFRLIMDYMGDLRIKPGSSSTETEKVTTQRRRPSSVGRFSLVNRLCNLGRTADSLRNEIYCSLIKQTTDNPSEASLLRGWHMIAACAHAFLPQDEDLLYCVILHADRARTFPDAIGGVAYYTYNILTGKCLLLSYPLTATAES